MLEAHINIKCKACGIVREVSRTSEIPKNVDYLWCNWCPLCEDKNANDYWREWYVYKKKPKTNTNNQTKLL